MEYVYIHGAHDVYSRSVYRFSEECDGYDAMAATSTSAPCTRAKRMIHYSSREAFSPINYKTRRVAVV